MKTLFGVQIAIMYMLLLYVLSAQCKLVGKISKCNNSTSDLCLHNISTVKGVRVIFLASEASDMFIKNIMSFGTLVIFKLKSTRDLTHGLTSRDCKEDIILDCSAVIETDSDLFNHTQLVVPKNCVSYERNFFIYQIANTHYSTSGKRRCFHTSGDLPLWNLSDCCMEQRSPPTSHYNCTLPLSKYRRDHSKHGSRRWPDMMGKMVEVVTFHRPIATIIHQDETDHASKLSNR